MVFVVVCVKWWENDVFLCVVCYVCLFCIFFFLNWKGSGKRIFFLSNEWYRKMFFFGVNYKSMFIDK